MIENTVTYTAVDSEVRCQIRVVHSEWQLTVDVTRPTRLQALADAIMHLITATNSQARVWQKFKA